MSNSHRFYTSRPGRGGIEYPIDLNPNHVNSDYWKDRLYNAMQIITKNPNMEKVWDSEIVPVRASVMLHALLAEKIVSGDLSKVARFMDAPDWQARAEDDAADIGTHTIISGGEVVEFGSKQWYNGIAPIEY